MCNQHERTNSTACGIATAGTTPSGYGSLFYVIAIWPSWHTTKRTILFRRPIRRRRRRRTFKKWSLTRLLGELGAFETSLAGVRRTLVVVFRVVAVFATHDCFAQFWYLYGYFYTVVTRVVEFHYFAVGLLGYIASVQCRCCCAKNRFGIITL